MHIAHNLHALPVSLEKGCAVTIGNFDGVHLGHQRLICGAVEAARTLKIPSVVITFDPHPRQVMCGAGAPPLLTSLPLKLEFIAALGVDMALVLPFTREIAAMSAEDFVDDVLVKALRVRHLFVGHDYAFGRGRSGNAALLTRLGAENGFLVTELSPVIAGGETVSSTRIRQAVARGDMGTACAMLGRPYSVEGVVAHGMNRGGALLGFPTANLHLEPELLVPATGAYAVRAALRERLDQRPGRAKELAGPDAALLLGVANVGKNPTFGDVTLRVETHLLDFNADIYDCELRILFIRRLRDERKFDGVDALVRQIRCDIDQARRLLV